MDENHTETVGPTKFPVLLLTSNTSGNMEKILKAHQTT